MQRTEGVLIRCTALDQFLCHMLEKQERRIVRIGGKSREARLEAYSLFNMKKHGDRAQGKEEKRHLWEIYTGLVHMRHNVEEATIQLQKLQLNWCELAHLLQVEDPDSLDQLSLQQQDAQDGFSIADGKGGIIQKDYFYRRWLAGEDPMPFSNLASLQQSKTMTVWTVS